jgi:hypothetical protein
MSLVDSSVQVGAGVRTTTVGSVLIRLFAKIQSEHRSSLVENEFRVSEALLGLAVALREMGTQRGSY